MNNSSQDTCGCCEGVKALTPIAIHNPPGLSALIYRIGSHGSFKTTMKAALSRHESLQGLKTRDDHDPAIALLDAWSTVLDVLTVYQERIANEGYLRTATERRSVLELARAIGYELNPGVAASTYLAFTLEDAPGSPEKVTIDIGTKVQSMPGPDEQPQTFETIEKIEARPEWNAMKPRLACPQDFNSQTRIFYLKGTETNLKLGDQVPLLAQNRDTKLIEKIPLQIVHVVPDYDNKRTRVDLAENPPPLSRVASSYSAGRFSTSLVEFSGLNIRNWVTNATWPNNDLFAFANTQRWPLAELIRHIQVTKNAPSTPTETGIFTMRIKTAPFGHNSHDQNSYDDINITTDSKKTKYSEDGCSICLETTFPAIQKDSWIVLKSTTQPARVYQVKEYNERYLADFGLNARVSMLTLSTNDNLTNYKLRETTIFAFSEKLELSDLPIDDDISGDSIKLDSMQIYLSIGQTLILTGERADLEGVINSELLILTNILHTGGYTTLIFTRALAHRYKRATVTLNANVARATHGETRREILGSGDAAQAFQKFILKQTPLTYILASTPSGTETTLQVRVNDILWDEVPNLNALDPTDHCYATLMADDGKVTVQFGDGIHGARLPSGIENVVATYRVGTGLPGMVKAGQLSLLMTRPLGVKAVTNPLAPTGAGDPEKFSHAKKNAPLTVRTLDRIVSLQDFEDFCRSFAGIGKAQAIWLWSGEKRIVHITIAAADGGVVDSSSALYKNLLAAINNAREPVQEILIASYQPFFFNVEAKVKIDQQYIKEKVISAITAALVDNFSFEKRSFGQPVTKSEVITGIQSIEGVEAVDLDYLYLTGLGPGLNDFLPASIAHWYTSQRCPPIKPAELLVINQKGIILKEMP